MTADLEAVTRTLVAHPPLIWTPPYAGGRVVGCGKCGECDYQAHLADVLTSSAAEDATRAAALRTELLAWAEGRRSHHNEFMAMEVDPSQRAATLTLVAQADAAEVQRLAAVLASLPDERLAEAEAKLQRLTEALEFYADPSTYHAVAFWFDPPCGGFDEDFSEDHGDEFYERPMPGARARAALSGGDAT